MKRAPGGRNIRPPSIRTDADEPASAEVLSVHATKPVTQLAIRVATQTNTVVLEGEAWCYTFPAD